MKEGQGPHLVLVPHPFVRQVSRPHRHCLDGEQLLAIKAATTVAYAVAKTRASHRASHRAHAPGVGGTALGGPRVSVVYEEEGAAPLLDGRGPGLGRDPTGPAVAVVVPVLLRPRDVPQLRRLVAALAAQETLPRLALFVDDGSPLPFKDLPLGDVFRPLVEAGVHVKVLALETNCGPAVARNAGMDAAWDILKPSAVMFTDLDCLPRAGWIKSALQRLEALGGVPEGEEEALLGGLAASAGRTVFDAFHERWGTLSPRLIPAAYADRGASDTCLYAPSCNLAVARRRLLARGGLRFDPCFRTSSFEDVAFCLKARLLLQAPVLLEPRMEVVHVFGYDEGILAAGPNLWRICKEFSKYGSWQPVVDMQYPFYESWLSVSIAATEVAMTLPASEEAVTLPAAKVAASI